MEVRWRLGGGEEDVVSVGYLQRVEQELVLVFLDAEDALCHFVEFGLCELVLGDERLVLLALH